MIQFVIIWHDLGICYRRPFLWDTAFKIIHWTLRSSSFSPSKATFFFFFPLRIDLLVPENAEQPMRSLLSTNRVEDVCKTALKTKQFNWRQFVQQLCHGIHNISLSVTNLFYFGQFNKYQLCQAYSHPFLQYILCPVSWYLKVPFSRCPARARKSVEVGRVPFTILPIQTQIHGSGICPLWCDSNSPVRTTNYRKYEES